MKKVERYTRFLDSDADDEQPNPFHKRRKRKLATINENQITEWSSNRSSVATELTSHALSPYRSKSSGIKRSFVENSTPIFVASPWDHYEQRRRFFAPFTMAVKTPITMETFLIKRVPELTESKSLVLR